MKKLILLIGAVTSILSGHTQNYTDALRYSRMQYLGTARFNAMGGSFGALGGDVSALTTNPASIGIYRNSEFTFSPSFYLNDNEARFRGRYQEDSKLNFNIGNIAYVGSYKGDPNGWKNYSFGVGHNRVSSFHKELQISGNSTNGSSIIDDYVIQLNRDNASIVDVEEYAYPFGPSQAYWLYMINPISDNQYAREIENTSSIDQTESLSVSGKQGESYFSFGGNYQDRLFLGGTFSIINSRYEEERKFTENYNYTPSASSRDSLGVEYSETTYLLTIGTGATAKLGAIYKINEAVRIGGSVHLPTFFGFREEYSFDASSKFSEGTAYDEEEVVSNWEYRLRTPWRYMGSIAYVYQNKGAINFEYEYVDYSTAKFNDRTGFDFNYSLTNQDVREVLSGTHNIRVGAEYRMEPFVIRGGVRYEDNPFNTGQLALNPDQNRKTFSLGTGFRSKNYNIDLTYMQSTMNTIDPVYTYSDASANIDQTEHRLIFTVGWKW